MERPIALLPAELAPTRSVNGASLISCGNMSAWKFEKNRDEIMFAPDCPESSSKQSMAKNEEKKEKGG
jgi:hypothetical protein